MKAAVLFPGQGSQYIGMGSEFIASSPGCRSTMDMADHQIGLVMISPWSAPTP